jgi:hypothetical protein
MGTSLYPVLEKEISGFKPSLEVSGQALSRYSEMIVAACKELGIKSVWDFYDETPDEVEGHLGEELTPELASTLAKESLKWTDAAEGIKWVQILRGHITNQADANANSVIEDLDALERVLMRAIQENTRFRLVLDM